MIFLITVFCLIPHYNHFTLPHYVLQNQSSSTEYIVITDGAFKKGQVGYEGLIYHSGNCNELDGNQPCYTSSCFMEGFSNDHAGFVEWGGNSHRLPLL